MAEKGCPGRSESVNHAYEAEKAVKAIIFAMQDNKNENKVRACKPGNTAVEKGQKIGPSRIRRRRRGRRPEPGDNTAKKKAEKFMDDSSIVACCLESFLESDNEEYQSGESGVIADVSSLSSENLSDISQDEMYYKVMRDDFVLDFEQKMMNEKLTIQNKKLNEIVSSLEKKLSSQLEQSKTLEKSLDGIKSTNSQLQKQKTRLQKTVTKQVETITKLQERFASLKKKYDDVCRRNTAEKSAKRLELNTIKTEMESKDAMLKSVEDTKQKLCEELNSNHEELMTDISDEIRKILTDLSKLSDCSLSSKTEQDPITLLQQVNYHIGLLSQQTSPLQKTIEKLRVNVDNRNKSISKLCDEKKNLKVELGEVEKQNKALQKEKGKLERELESVKKESTKAKNSSQCLKTRLEDLKTNMKSLRREKETVMKEKQIVQTKLKQVGISEDIMKKELKKRREIMKIRENKSRRLVTSEIREDIHELSMKSDDELSDLDASICRLDSYKRESKAQPHDSEAVREYLSKSASGLIKKHEQMCQQATHLDVTLDKIKLDGQDIHELAQNLSHKNTTLENKYAELLEKLDRSDIQQSALKQALHQNCVVLDRYVGKRQELKSENQTLTNQVTLTTENLQKDQIIIAQLRQELRNTQMENTKLKSERLEHASSLDNYRALLRGYCRVACRASEMRGINGELSTFVVFMEQQLTVLARKVNIVYEDLNLLQILYRKMKKFSGKHLRISSVFVGDNVSSKALQNNLETVSEKLRQKLGLVAFLKHNLDAERTEAGNLLRKITIAFGKGEDRKTTAQMCVTKSTKTLSCFTGFNKRLSENTTSLKDKQFSIVVQLALARLELANEIRESLEMETKLTTLGENGKEYTRLLLTKYNHEDDTDYYLLLRKKKCLQTEYIFNEAQEGLLEKQIMLLKKRRKTCVKALRKYEDEIDQDTEQSSVLQTLIAILLTTPCDDAMTSSSDTVTSPDSDDVTSLKSETMSEKTDVLTSSDITKSGSLNSVTPSKNETLNKQ